MIKKTLLLSVLILVGVYLLLAVTAFNSKSGDQTCEGMELIIRDSINAGFVTQQEITALLKKNNLYPVGKRMDEVVSGDVEDILANHPLINEIECYKTPNGKLNIEVTQRMPILRIINRNGENYYIDNRGEIMPRDTKCIAHLAIATGYVDKQFAMNELYQFALFLQNNKFWNAQIEQMNVLRGKEVELVPRVGDHIIFLGKLDDFEKKLSRVKEFYRKGLNKVGWNKYSRINVEFGNQIICTKANDK